jgi:NO-binding membrane sensor protein with MHYT domain
LIDEYKLTEEEILTEEARYEQELTKRLEADMKSDNWFAQSVRPLGFMIWTVIVLLMIFMDGNLRNGFQIKDAYLPLIETVYVSYISFYIGSRGVEKTIRLWREQDKK